MNDLIPYVARAAARNATTLRLPSLRSSSGVFAFLGQRRRLPSRRRRKPIISRWKGAEGASCERWKRGRLVPIA